MSILVQFTDVHFPSLTPNTYDNLNNVKLDLNISTRSVNFSANNKTAFSFSLQIRQGDDKFLLSVWLCIF